MSPHNYRKTGIHTHTHTESYTVSAVVPTKHSWQTTHTNTVLHTWTSIFLHFADFHKLHMVSSAVTNKPKRKCRQRKKKCFPPCRNLMSLLESLFAQTWDWSFRTRSCLTARQKLLPLFGTITIKVITVEEHELADQTGKYGYIHACFATVGYYTVNTPYAFTLWCSRCRTSSVIWHKEQRRWGVKPIQKNLSLSVSHTHTQIWIPQHCSMRLLHPHWRERKEEENRWERKRKREWKKEYMWWWGWGWGGGCKGWGGKARTACRIVKDTSRGDWEREKKRGGGEPTRERLWKRMRRNGRIEGWMSGWEREGGMD